MLNPSLRGAVFEGVKTFALEGLGSAAKRKPQPVFPVMLEHLLHRLGLLETAFLITPNCPLAEFEDVQANRLNLQIFEHIAQQQL